jgi:hypothetical protein
MKYDLVLAQALSSDPRESLESSVLRDRTPEELIEMLQDSAKGGFKQQQEKLAEAEKVAVSPGWVGNVVHGAGKVIGQTAKGRSRLAGFADRMAATGAAHFSDATHGFNMTPAKKSFTKGLAMKNMSAAGAAHHELTASKSLASGGTDLMKAGSVADAAKHVVGKTLRAAKGASKSVARRAATGAAAGAVGGGAVALQKDNPTGGGVAKGALTGAAAGALGGAAAKPTAKAIVKMKGPVGDFARRSVRSSQIHDVVQAVKKPFTKTSMKENTKRDLKFMGAGGAVGGAAGYTVSRDALKRLFNEASFSKKKEFVRDFRETIGHKRGPRKVLNGLVGGYTGAAAGAGMLVGSAAHHLTKKKEKSSSIKLKTAGPIAGMAQKALGAGMRMATTTPGATRAAVGGAAGAIGGAAGAQPGHRMGGLLAGGAAGALAGYAAKPAAMALGSMPNAAGRMAGGALKRTSMGMGATGAAGGVAADKMQINRIAQMAGRKNQPWRRWDDGQLYACGPKGQFPLLLLHRQNIKGLLPSHGGTVGATLPKTGPSMPRPATASVSNDAGARAAVRGWRAQRHEADGQVFRSRSPGHLLGDRSGTGWTQR